MALNSIFIRKITFNCSGALLGLIGSLSPLRFYSSAQALKPNNMQQKQQEQIQFGSRIAPGISSTLQPDSGIVTITFNRAEKANAFSLDMYKNLAELITEANSEPEAKYVVLTGSGKYFSAGNELSNFDSSGSDRLAPRYMADKVLGFITSLINLRKPIFALVNGPAIGIGLTLLPHCDAVYSTKSAYFRSPFTLLGICPEAGSSYLFPTIMGFAKAADMLMFNATLSSAEALNCGLVTRVFPDESFEAESWTLVQETAKLPYQALLTSKELIRGPIREKLHSINKIEFDHIAQLTASQDCKDAIAKLRKKK